MILNFITACCKSLNLANKTSIRFCVRTVTFVRMVHLGNE